MDNRCEPRFTADQNISITVLSACPSRMNARVRNASGRGLGLLLPAAIPPGTAIRIDLDDAIILGEVIYCCADGDGYFMGIHLEQMLRDLADLDRSFQDAADLPSTASRETR